LYLYKHVFYFFLFIGITYLLFEVSCMYVCYLLFPINNNNNSFPQPLRNLSERKRWKLQCESKKSPHPTPVTCGFWHACFETECIMTLQGHPRSLILAPVESAYMILYSTSKVTLVLSCRVSEILELLYAESHFFSTPPPFGRKIRSVPLGIDPWCVGCKERTSQANWWWNYSRRIPTYVTTIHQRHRRTDRQTVRQTDGQTCDRKTALCTVVHRVVKTFTFPFNIASN